MILSFLPREWFSWTIVRQEVAEPVAVLLLALIFGLFIAMLVDAVKHPYRLSKPGKRRRSFDSNSQRPHEEDSRDRVINILK